MLLFFDDEPVSVQSGASLYADPYQERAWGAVILLAAVGMTAAKMAVLWGIATMTMSALRGLLPLERA